MVELLIVMAILAILFTIGVRSYSTSQSRARDGQRKSDLHSISQALEVYYNDKGEYPTSAGSDTGIDDQEWGGSFVDPDETGTVYMTELPADPRGQAYYYESTDGTYYQLYALLENASDQALSLGDGGVVMVYTDTDCGSAACNYGIASSNSTPAEGHTLAVPE